MTSFNYTGKKVVGDCESWYVNGLLHREDGPAKTYLSGDTSWWKHGHLHRLDGPAQLMLNHNFEAWWINGIMLKPEQVIEQQKIIALSKQASKEAGINTDF